MLSMIGLFVGLYAVSLGLVALQPEFNEIIMTVSALFIIVIYLINRYAKATADNNSFQYNSVRLCIIAAAFILFGAIIQLSLLGRPSTTSLSTISSGSRRLSEFAPLTDLSHCTSSLTHGNWNTPPCPNTAKYLSATCDMEIWQWDTTSCPFKMLERSDLQEVFHGKKLVFMGDSMTRNVFYAMNSLIDKTSNESTFKSAYHDDIKFSFANSNTTIDFFWAPFVSNLTDHMYKLKPSDYDVFVLGAAAWDALHHRSLPVYAAHLNELSRVLARFSEVSFTTWLLPTTIVDSLLVDPDKRAYMSEEIIETYRQTYLSSTLSQQISLSINQSAFTINQQSKSVDGVHYSAPISQVISQVVSNGYLLKYPDARLLSSDEEKVKSAPKSGSMGHPLYGIMVLLFSLIMTFLMDSFFGIGVLSLILFGRFLDWDEAYIPLLTKLGLFTNGYNRKDIEASLHAESQLELETEEEASMAPLILRS